MLFGVSVTDGDSVGVGVGDAFFRFDFGVGDGVGEAFFRFGEAVGDGVGVGFFAECFRCLRVGLGVGVGWKIFLIFEPNDSSAAYEVEALNESTRIKKQWIIFFKVIDAVRRSVKRQLRRLTQTPYRLPFSAVNRARNQNWMRCSRLRRRDFLEDGFVEANSAFEIFERKIFVRRVRAAIG